MVEADKEYAFEGSDGTASLPGLFEDRSQLLIYHFMSCRRRSDRFRAAGELAAQAAGGRQISRFWVRPRI